MDFAAVTRQELDPGEEIQALPHVGRPLRCLDGWRRGWGIGTCIHAYHL